MRRYSRSFAIFTIAGIALTVGAFVSACTLDEEGTINLGDDPTGNTTSSSTSSSGDTSSSSSSGTTSSSSSSSGTTSSSSSASSASSSSSSSSASSSSSSSASSSSSSSSGGGPTCGNLIVEGPEECDNDVLKAEGDGCGRDCKIEDPTTCPGTAIHLAKGQTVVVSGDTSTATEDKFISSRNGIPGSNCGAGSWTGMDLIYHVIPEAQGMLNVTLNPTYDAGFLRIRQGCPAMTNQEVACRWESSGPVSISLGVMVNGVYHLAADSWNDQAGPFTMTITLQ